MDTVIVLSCSVPVNFYTLPKSVYPRGMGIFPCPVENPPLPAFLKRVDSFLKACC